MREKHSRNLTIAPVPLEQGMQYVSDETESYSQNHGRDVDIADGRNHLLNGRQHRSHNFIEGAPGLIVPIDIGKPGEQAPENQRHAENTDNTIDNLNNWIHVSGP